MPYQMISKRDWGSLIEKDSHLELVSDELDLGEAMLGVGENGYDLVKSDSWKPLEKLIDGCAGFKVLKQGAHRHTRATKNPGTAEFAFAAFYLLTIAPIQHVQHDMLHFCHGE